MPHITLRNRYRNEDLPELVRIENECFPPLLAWSPAQLSSSFLSPRSIFFIAEDAGGIVGFVFGDAESRRPCGYIESLEVQPASQKKGIGSQLLQAIEMAFRERAIKCVRFEVQVSNTPAITLYEKNGYRAERTIPQFYSDGTAAFAMFKNL